MDERLTVERLGDQGDGICASKQGAVFVPFTLPGERVTVEGAKQNRRLIEILQPSALRIEPICDHFGVCGGCQMQHLQEAAYRQWKTGLLTTSLERVGIDPAGIEFVAPTGQRRRLVLTARQTDGKVELGFLQRGSHRLVPITHCPVARPELSQNLQPIARLIANLGHRGKAMQVSVLSCDNGLDIAVITQAGLSRETHRKLAGAFAATEYCRLTVNGELIAENRRPFIRIGTVNVSPVAGGFVQAVEEAEWEMADLVVNHLSGCKHVADLFCGIGTFGLRLAEHCRVWAIEADASSLQSLDLAWRGSGGSLRDVRVERRDLYTRPLMAAEMKKLDGLVLDPPPGRSTASGKTNRPFRRAEGCFGLLQSKELCAGSRDFDGSRIFPETPGGRRSV